ncbi:HSP70-6 [Symbiodinium sp. KB8]|nr:HSP70-6 [Symbiodinium sp. KB8]
MAASTRRKGRASRVASCAEVAPGEKVVGIDLGTTNSAIAAMEAGAPTVIPNAEAYFNDSQRQMPEKKAGLDVLRIVNEPTAASLVHGLEKANNETILVFDLGGVAFDVSVLEVGDGVCEVLATNGDTNLGGDDFDKVIVDWLEGIDFLKDRQAKIELSGVQEAKISLPFVTADAMGPKHIEQSLSRAKLVGGKKSVNPDEVVAGGAAVQAGVPAGDVKDIVLLDVSPLSLIVETLGGVATALIPPRNTTIPTKKTEVCSTATDSQPSVEIVVLQGERQFAKDNKILGTFRFDGVPPAPRGVPQIEVTFDIDANGDLLRTQTEANAAEDAKRKDSVETKNSAESLAYQTEKQLSDLEKVPADLKASIEPKLQALKDKVGEAKRDTELLKTMTKDLQEELMKVGQAAYANTATGAPTPSHAKDDVIDVDGQ